MSGENVEVAVVLEESVLAVEHIASPQRSRRATFALAGAALFGALLFAGLSIHAVAVARDNHRAHRAWIDAGGHGFDFRPQRLHPLSDLGAVVSLVTALGGGVWALLRVRREKTGFTVGRGRGVDFALDVDDTTLVRAGADGFHFTPAPGMFLPAGPIARGARLRASLGRTSFLISSVAAPRLADDLARAVDRRALGYAAASTAAHALLVLLFFLIPAEGHGFIVDDLGARRRRTRLEFKPQETPRVEPSRGEGGGSQGGVAPAELGPRGALGTQQATAAERRGKIRRIADEPTLGRPVENPTAARSAGILGVIRAQRPQLSAVTAMASFSSGLDEEDILGGWRGADVGDSRGFGTGLDGDGPGGGGPQRYATIGAGPNRYGPFTGPPGSGPNMLPQRRPRPTFVLGTPVVPEGVDKNLIRRYVRQKHAQISHCYERELVGSPGLAGTATTAFTIDANGRVIAVKASGMVPAVERCVEEVLRSIQFPAGGGIVNVTSYPFTFHRVGG